MKAVYNYGYIRWSGTGYVTKPVVTRYIIRIEPNGPGLRWPLSWKVPTARQWSVGAMVLAVTMGIFVGLCF